MLRGSGDGCLTAESVQSTALTLEGVDYVHSSHGLPLGVLGVGDGITDHVLKENLEDTAGLLVDEARDTLDTTTASQTADSGLGDTLDVVTQNFAVTLGAAFAEAFSSFSASRHLELVCFSCRDETDVEPSGGGIYMFASQGPASPPAISLDAGRNGVIPASHYYALISFSQARRDQNIADLVSIETKVFVYVCSARSARLS